MSDEREFLDGGFNEVNDVDPEQAVKIAEDEAIEWRDRAKEVESERDALAARLAEVEAENAELIEKLKAGLSRDDRTSLSSLFGYDLGVEEGRAEGQAERDRLAQRGVELLEKVQLFAATGQRVTQERDEAIGHLRIVLEGGHSGAAREFLARFPEKEDGA